MLHALSQYPRPFVVACAALATVFVLWLALRILKVALSLLAVAAIVAVGAAVAWWLMN
jgi:hypothetical protein